VNDTVVPVPDVDSLPTVTGQCSATVASAPTATDNCAGQVIGTTTDPLTHTEQGTYLVTWTYNDENGNVSTQTQTVIVNDTIAPVPDVDPLPDAVGQCSVTITGAPIATDNCAGVVTGTTTDPLTYTVQGTYVATWTYDDGNGNVSTHTQTVIVEDTISPTIDSFTLSPNVLWPPNHKMIPIEVEVTGSDNCSETTGLTFDLFLITMNEGDETNTYDPYFDGNTGDGNTSDDIQVASRKKRSWKRPSLYNHLQSHG